MKKLSLILLINALVCLNAMGELRYHEASQFKIIGRATDASEKIYTRLPDSLKGKIRNELWDLGQNTAGLAIRFHSNATKIGAKWKNHAVFNMNHMTPTGIRGLDLYCLQDDGSWTFVNSARPCEKKTNSAIIMENMSDKDREYMLYLPLYQGIDSLEIGINESAVIGTPHIMLPKDEKPIVWYGTSITQGGCANRPGMAATNILERKLNRVVINLGFSGNGRLDPEIAEVMANVDASIYILDMLPNVTNEQINERIERFYNILRKAHPYTPILLMQNPEFPHMRFNSEVNEKICEKNVTLKSFCNKFRKSGDKNIHYISSEGMMGKDNEATVDCNHFTDLGFMRCADYMLPIIKKYMK